MNTFGVSFLQSSPFQTVEPIADVLQSPSMQAMVNFDEFIANTNSDGQSVCHTPSFKLLSFDIVPAETVSEKVSNNLTSSFPGNQLNALIGDNHLHEMMVC